MTPTRQVIIPATNKAPPPMNTGRSFAQANTLPESIVSRHELAAAAVNTGPRTTMIIPKMKMSDLNLRRASVFQKRSSILRQFVSQFSKSAPAFGKTKKQDSYLGSSGHGAVQFRSPSGTEQIHYLSPKPNRFQENLLSHLRKRHEDQSIQLGLWIFISQRCLLRVLDLPL